MAEFVQSIENIFRTYVFRIPDYQRGYAWGEKQWSDLLEDLELLPPAVDHFTGTLVLRQTGPENNRVRDVEGRSFTTIDVIDGQQRLTTCVILIKAIFDQFQSLNQHLDFANGLREMYLYSTDRNKQPFTKLALNQDCQNFFANDVLGLNPGFYGPQIRSHLLLSGAKDHFATYLENQRIRLGNDFADWLLEFSDKVTMQLKMIVYQVSSEQDAGVIFETMNDRGKPLTELEKVKNYLLYLASKLQLPEPHHLDVKINETWAHIFEELMSAELSDISHEDQLLRSHWLMAYNADLNKWHQSRSVKDRFSLRLYRERHTDLLRDLHDYLDSLYKAATAYCDIHKPERDGAFRDCPDRHLRERIVHAGEKFARLGARAGFLPLLIALRVKPADSGETYLKAITLCEKYDFRVYQWRGLRANTGQTRLFLLGNGYYRTQNSQVVLDDLARSLLRYCSDDQFQERFTRETEDWYDWSGLKYFLYEYEEELASREREKPYYRWEELWDTKRDTIEHILPQTPVDVYWTDRFDEKERQRWTHDIGNLTLTYDNSALSNKSFPAKKGGPAEKTCYSTSKLFIEQQLAGILDWTVDAIEKRRARILEWAVTRWHVDPPTVTQPPAADSKADADEGFFTRAETLGIGDDLRAVHDLVTKYRLHPYLSRRSASYAFPYNWAIRLLTVYPHDGWFWLRVRWWNFARFPGMTRERVQELIGDTEWRQFSAEQAGGFLEQLEQLFQEIEELAPEPEAAQPAPPSRAENHLRSEAERLGTLAEYEALINAMPRDLLRPRTQVGWWVVRFADPGHPRAALFWVGPNLYFNLNLPEVERCLRIPASRIREILGDIKEQHLHKEEVAPLVERLKQLFAEAHPQ